MIKEYIWTGQKFHGVDGFNGVFHDRKADINLGLNTIHNRAKTILKPHFEFFLIHFTQKCSKPRTTDTRRQNP